jgi:hypothetical protein
MNYLVSNYNFIGMYDPPDWIGYGIRIDGDGYPVDFRLQNLWIYSCAIGIFIPDYVEGLYISNFEIINVTKGIVGKWVTGVSVLASQADTGVLSPRIGPGHINCRQTGVELVNVNQGVVSGLNIYLNPEVADINVYGIVLTNGGGNSVSDCHIAKFTSNATNKYGIFFNGVYDSIISDNKSSAVDTCVYLSDSSDRNNVESNHNSTGINTAYANASALNNIFSGNKGTTLSGAVVSLADWRNYGEPRVFTISESVVLTGGDTFETISVSAPSGMFAAVPVYAILQSEGSDEMIGWYLPGSSTVTSLAFRIQRNGVTTLPAGARAFRGVAIGV